MFLQLFKLQLLKAIRSVTLGRKVITGIIIVILAFIVLGSILMIGFGLPTLLRKITGQFNVIPVLNTLLIFFFLLEIMYRFFLQKMTVLELQHYLHLPIGRPKIIHFLLFRSFFSPYNLIAVLLFLPFYILEIHGAYPQPFAMLWLINIVFISWTFHWLMLWYKQKYGDTLGGFLALIGFFSLVAGASYYNWLDLRMWVEPYFAASLQHVYPFAITLGCFCASYALIFNFYKKHAYLEELKSKKKSIFNGETFSLFGRFGEAGAMADLEFKLILRHKKSRSYLFISLLFLAYGFIYYTNDTFSTQEISWVSIPIGIIITGMFIMHYGQLYLSWNSPYFDFFLSQNKGIENLVKGKYLVLASISLISFIITLPYVYFGENIFLMNIAAFLFNIGINIHGIIFLALWKPKPMDLSKGNMFNYEGIGLAQFLLAIPMIGLPYIIYLPVSYFLGGYIGLAALALVGVMGILFKEKIMLIESNFIRQKRYAISASFRQEL